MTFQVSPGVVVSELDLTTVIPAVSTSIGGFVGEFEWGPVDQVTLVSNEIDLAKRFATPNTNIPATDFLTAASFLAYSNSLKVVRVVEKLTDALEGTTAATNAGTSITPVLALNETQVLDGLVDLTPGGAIVARYPGAIANGLKVFILDNTNFETTGFEFASNLFNTAPDIGEIHVVVIDETGAFTGQPSTVVETFAYLSITEGSKAADGSNNYFVDVVNNGSRYIYIGDDVLAVGGEYTLADGSNGSSTTADELLSGWDLFKNAEEHDVNLLFVGARNSSVGQYVTQNIAEVRKDCVVFISPAREDVVGTNSQLNNITTFVSGLGLNSSYAFIDSGWKSTYNKYQDRYEWIPLNGDIAGLCARTDNDRDPWFSPAGLNRGNIKNVYKLSWSPSQAQRDELYKRSVNPVINMPGVGPILYGDKTALSRPSAFDRINVRRLFIVLQKAISTAARYSLFELNDQFTRAQFVNIVEPFLREVKARRGIYDFRVVCDETNNSGEVIDSNRFVGDIYIKPARSINFIALNFVAVRTNVEFNEVVGLAA